VGREVGLHRATANPEPRDQATMVGDREPQSMSRQKWPRYPNSHRPPTQRVLLHKPVHEITDVCRDWDQ
jgi:hypothetical protein